MARKHGADIAVLAALVVVVCGAFATLVALAATGSLSSDAGAQALGLIGSLAVPVIGLLIVRVDARLGQVKKQLNGGLDERMINAARRVLQEERQQRKTDLGITE